MDASVAIKWVVDEPDTAQAAAIEDFDLVAPELLHVECCNILWKLAQRGELSAALAMRKMEVLTSKPLALVPDRDVARRALQIALELRHPAYDAMYLATAEVHNSRVVTADTRLLRRVAASPFANLVINLPDAAAH